MIRNYRDHAANERTYLAWIRTGITVMALGFLIEKFEIFIRSLAQGLPGAQISGLVVHSQINQVSIALVALGILMIIAATARYFSIKRELDSEGSVQFRGVALSLSIAGAIVAFGIYLLLYLARGL